MVTNPLLPDDENPVATETEPDNPDDATSPVNKATVPALLLELDPDVTITKPPTPDPEECPPDTETAPP